MIVRTRERPAEVWARFLVPHEGFQIQGEPPLFAARVAGASSRVLGLFREMITHLEPLVSVAVDDWRRGRTWCGSAVSRDDVCRELVGCSAELARTAGTEIAVFDDEDQVTLTANLDLWVHGRTARWYHLLRGRGLRPHAALPARSWRLRRGEFPPSIEATACLTSLVQHLRLEER